METCLLCLRIIDTETDCISASSTEWKEFDMAEKIEKHFWSLININSKSLMCLSCWRAVNFFHNFYMRIEKAHLNFNEIKPEPDEEAVECKEELTQLLCNEHDYADPTKTKVECYFSEPEILLDQTQLFVLQQETSDNKTGIVVPKPRKTLQTYNDQADSDPLEEAENISSETSRKRKQISIKGKFSTNIPGHNTVIESENYDDRIETAEIESHESAKFSGKTRMNREECDKFINEHFKEINCDICQIPLENFSSTQKHFLETHQKKGYLFCCNRKYFKRSDLVDHIHCHLNPNHFKCTKCDKVLSDRVRLEKHKAVVHSGMKARRHRCGICCKSFLEIHDLNMHKLTHMSEADKKFPCEECGKLYASAHLLHRHTQAVHLKKFIKICSICGKSLSSSTELKFHMAKHEEITPTIYCDVCGLLMTTEQGLRRHKASQHPVDGKKDHHCPICPKISPTIKALRKHISTMHEKGPDYKCTVCEKVFKRAEVLREHMALHTGTPLYTCPWCPKKFNSNSNMHSHRKKVHPKEYEESKLKKYVRHVLQLNNK